MRRRSILVVDDDPNDQFLVQTALKQVNVHELVYGVSDGVEALAYLRGEGEYGDREIFCFPSLLLIDLKMPRMNGFELLRSLQNDRNLSVIPKIIFTSSADLNDVTNAYLLGASSYQVKSQTMAGLRAQLKLIYEYWKQCEVPEMDPSGHLLPTESGGKLSERVPGLDQLAVKH